MYRLDLHTHSQLSPDGALTADDYSHMLTSGKLQGVAITDHDQIMFAKTMHEKLGDIIIVGEEITTREGEVIGLYLKEVIPPKLSAMETVKRIHTQGGLVYIPHPFETARKGLTLETLNEIIDHVDIIETYNGRTLQNKGAQARIWATTHAISQASSSDAHGRRGWGNTASILSQTPTRTTLVGLLKTAAQDTTGTGIIGRLYPKANRLRKRGSHA